MSEALTRLWAERIPGERTTIWIASALLAFGLAYAYLWLPVTRERDRLLVRVPELRAQTHTLERDARELERLKVGSIASPELRSAIQQAAAASKLPDSALAIARQDSSTVRVVIASARAEHAFTFVARLQSIAGVRIENVRVTSLGDGDHVKVQAALFSAR